jgi:ABC-2 type transport system ATP-binding protein
MKEAHPGAYEVRLKGDAGSFIERLRRVGGDAEPHGDGLLVHLGNGQTPALLWQIAAELGEQIRSLRPQRSTLEEVFLKAVGEKA